MSPAERKAKLERKRQEHLDAEAATLTTFTPSKGSSKMKVQGKAHDRLYEAAQMTQTAKAERIKMAHQEELGRYRRTPQKK